MNDQNIPYIAHESEMTRQERHVKRLIIALVISVILMFASNALWLYAWCQYDYTSDTRSTVTVDGKDGIASYIGNNGSVINGESSSQDSQT